jgi:hypothetical protein
VEFAPRSKEIAMLRLMFVGLCAGLLLSSAALAQGGPARGPYTPVRPPISPYMNFFRPDVGGVPSYYMFVRPRIDIQQRFQQVDQDLGTLEGQLQRRGPARPGVGQPSTAATFMNYSHFYPAKSAAGPVR